MTLLQFVVYVLGGLVVAGGATLIGPVIAGILRGDES